MLPTSSDSFENPYQPGSAFTPSPGMPAGAVALPMYCSVMFILDILCCCLRLLFVGGGVFGYYVMRQQGDNPLLPTAIFEIAAGALIVLAGIPANILLLFRQSLGVVLGYAAVVGVLANCGVAVWQLTIGMGTIPDGPQQIGFIVGGLFVLALRLGVLGLYIAALIQFSRWHRKQRAA